MNRRKPALLRRGHNVQVISPASTPHQYEVCEQGVRYLSEKGFNVQKGKYIYEKKDYLAGEDDRRAEDLKKALFGSGRAVFATRGGYGCARLVPFLKALSVVPPIQILMGYSDLTTLLLYAYTCWNWVTYYGPMVGVEMGKEDFESSFTAQCFSFLLEHNPEYYTVPDLPYLEMECLVPGKAEGELVGGCLSVLSPVLGTSFCPDFRGKILFFEEVGEPLYKIDRMLMHLANAGVFEQVEGVIIGEMIECERSSAKLRLKDLFYQLLAPYGKPVIINAPFGHGREKCIFPLGVKAYLDADNTEICFLEKLWKED